MQETATKSKRFLTLFFCGLILWGCQQEIIPQLEIDPNGVQAGDGVARAIVAVAALDGSEDNLLDGSSCTTVLFPVRGILEDQTLQFQNLEEVEALGAGALEVDWLFPMQVRLSDYRVITLDAEEQLESIQEGCTEGGGDLDNECVDFQYPFTIRQYNTRTEDAITQEIGDDEAAFLTFSSPDFITTIQYPLTLIDELGNAISVASNDELTTEVLSRENTCDEEDIVEFESVFEQAIVDLFTSSTWRISHYSVDGADETTQYSGYSLEFREDFSMLASGSEDIEGEWEALLLDTSNGVAFDFDTEQAAFVALNGSWVILNPNESPINLEYQESEGGIVRLQLSQN